MTTIVAKETPDGVIFAADTQITTGYQINEGWLDKVAVNGPIAFGAAGYLRIIQALEYMPLPPTPHATTDSAIDRYVTLELLEAIREACTDEDKMALENSSILIAVRGRVYNVNGCDLSWTRNTSGDYAIGSGSEYALGALAAGATPKQSIKIASRYDVGTGSEVRVRVFPKETTP